jgi:hypothetical protein
VKKKNKKGTHKLPVITFKNSSHDDLLPFSAKTLVIEDLSEGDLQKLYNKIAIGEAFVQIEQCRFADDDLGDNENLFSIIGPRLSNYLLRTEDIACIYVTTVTTTNVEEK